ncbi:hypothetical protein WB44_00340 [Synechococcus sp. WH 8020]|nr:hypothetical protein WB44_00340 [Synechococcus sp. WH 8020]
MIAIQSTVNIKTIRFNRILRSDYRQKDNSQRLRNRLHQESILSHNYLKFKKEVIDNIKVIAVHGPSDN